jgi:flagellar assembly protein FliH
VRLAEVERQGQARTAEARAAGLREGEAEGRRKAAAEMHAAIERMARAVAEMAGLRAELRKDAEADTVQLALAIARRVLHREIAADPDALKGVLLAALAKLQGQEISRVRVHPSQAALMTDCLRTVASGQSIEVLADHTREVGDAIFETQRGNLDASVETQLGEIERGLADRLRRPQ